MIVGDITNISIFNKLVDLFLKNHCKFLIATPPCQGMSIAGKMQENDSRNRLIYYVIEFIKKTNPENILIENVPAFLKFNININNTKIQIKDYIISELEPLGYKLNFDVKDAADFKTPQHRKRAIFLISKLKK
jgi:DNA (cytosine-5)-methyltransferase 1